MDATSQQVDPNAATPLKILAKGEDTTQTDDTQEPGMEQLIHIHVGPQKVTADGDYKIEHSPVSPYRGKGIGKGALPASPFTDRKMSSLGNQGFGSATPGRRQPKPIVNGEASPDNSPTVPKFGDWDENNPSAADGFTQVFDQVREQRQNGGGTRIASTKVPSKSRQGTFNNSSEGCCCCFRWAKR